MARWVGYEPQGDDSISHMANEWICMLNDFCYINRMKATLFFRHCTAIWLVVLMLTPVGCAWKTSDRKEKIQSAEKATSAVKSERILIGRVHSRPGHGNFVLVETYGTSQVDAGTQLFTINSEGDSEVKRSKLVVSGERRSIFLVVDVIEGVVVEGDAVFQERSSSEVNTSKSLADDAATIQSVGASGQLVNPPSLENRNRAKAD